ncbi:MAG: CoA-binding protein [Bacteroidota bacterium]
MPVEDDVRITSILRTARSIAVVGASNKPYRDSNGIAEFLIRMGYDVVPVNPSYTEANGRRCYPNLAAIGRPADVVDVFRNPDAVDEVVDEAIATGAKVLWLQLGVVNEAAAARAESAGLEVIMDRCIAVEHRRLIRT